MKNSHMKVSSTTYKASIGILFCIFYLCSCQSPQKQVNNPQETENGIITLTADYPIEKDTLTLSEIADTVFYVKLQQQGISNNARIEYLDSHEEEVWTFCRINRISIYIHLWMNASGNMI